MALAGNSSNEHSSTFETLIENIKLVSGQIKDGESRKEEKDSFEKDVFWTHLDAVFKRLSMDTTKMSLAFSKTPFPSNKNTETMVQELERSVLTVVSIYYSLPISQGATLRRHLQKCVLRILDCLESFVVGLSQCVHSESHQKRLQWTGGVWDAADFTLSKDNKECVLAELRQTAELVEDTLGEIAEAEESDGQFDGFGLEEEADNASVWSEQDKSVIVACTGLVKTMKSVMKKTRESVQRRGKTDTPEEISTLDELATLAGNTNAVVDDFISGIYAPINYVALLQNGKVLSELIQKILKFLKDSSLTSNEDAKWLDFLSGANVHNKDKLEQSTLVNPQQGS